MERTIELLGKTVTYTVRRNSRSRHLRLTVYPGGKVVATWPKYVPKFLLDRFIREKESWLVATIEKLSQIQPRQTASQARVEYLKYKTKARLLAKTRLEYFNQFYNFSYNNISIRNQQTRWGSCSSQKNLNFNYRIALIPPELADYIIVHELCHTKEMNHSSNFWKLVAKTIPNHRYLRFKLHQYSLRID